MTESFTWAQNDSNIEHFRQKGMILAFDIKESLTSNSFAKAFFKEALSKEILVRPIGRTIYIMPPYTLSEDELDILSNGIQKTLHLVLQNRV
jgi:adenosylmethionine-8-amino-7-oxononanoate aminotransferase